MRITSINDRPYTPALVKQILDEKGELLIQRSIESSVHPYAYSSTGDTLTILLEADGSPPAERRGLVLPLQTNVSSVTNLTGYAPRLDGWIRIIRSGALVAAATRSLDDVLAELEGLRPDSASLRLVHCCTQGANWDIKGSMPRVVGKDARDIDILRQLQAGDLDAVRSRYCTYPARFTIDPASALHVEVRRKRGTTLYAATLAYRIRTGLAGEPALTDHYTQTLMARTKVEPNPPR